MTEIIGVFVAWPYANGDIHFGHVAGAYLPADIFARYHRLRGNRVLMVSGSDSHGTPITVKAEQEGKTPRDVFEYYHHRFLEAWRDLGISFDLFTHTDTENHWSVSQDIFRVLWDKGYIFRKPMTQLYCENDAMFLPDRYVEGTCPHCDYDGARGDQCENCGKLLDAFEVVNPRCKLCGHRPVVRETEHFFLDLPAFNEALIKWAEKQTHWRPNVYRFTLNYLRDGLEPRPVSRDILWGITVPVEGFEQKRIYVWFEAVIGYLSASVEWAKNQHQPDAWEDWWKNGRGKGYYFIGKDNIPFHSIVWPAQLMGYGGLNLPYDVPANEFMNLEGQKLSTSRNWAVWVPDYLSRYEPDPLRYYLTANAPEARDTDFAWADFVRRNNDELVAAWGNLAHRVLTFTYRRFDRQVPEPGPLNEVDQNLLAKVEDAFDEVGNRLAACRFKAAQAEAMALARTVNKYLEDKAPWLQIKEDRQAAATTLFVALRAIDSLKVLLAPFTPFSAEQLNHYLGYDRPLFGELRIERFQEEEREHEALVYRGEHNEDMWHSSTLPSGQALREPKPLFAVLDEAVVEEERAKLGAPTT
jgi:methionyl-tRNA synthetase